MSSKKPKSSIFGDFWLFTFESKIHKDPKQDCQNHKLTYKIIWFYKSTYSYCGKSCKKKFNENNVKLVKTWFYGRFYVKYKYYPN